MDASAAGHVLVVRGVAEQLSAVVRDEDLLLELDSLVRSLDAHARLDAEHHPGLEPAGVVVLAPFVRGPEESRRAST